MYGLTLQDLEIIKDVLKKFPQIHEGIIFGSRALGTFKKGSDVDIALKGQQVDKIVGDVSAILNEESSLPYFFDIIDYQSITNDHLIDHINRVGKIFYTP